MGVASRFFTEPTAAKWQKVVDAGITEVVLGLTRGVNADALLDSARSTSLTIEDDCMLLANMYRNP